MVNINNLNAGDMTLTSGSASYSETRFTLQGGTVETYNITGTLDRQWMIANGYYNGNDDVWIKTITQADIGNTVTSVGANAFKRCIVLTSVTIPNSVTYIYNDVFENCNSLTSVTIGSGIQRIGSEAFATYGNPITLTIGKSVAEVQAMGQDYYDPGESVTYFEWNLPSGSTIVCTDDTITI